MDMTNFPVFGAMVPPEFMPVIGKVMVQHAYMDAKLQEAVCHVAEIDYSAGVSILSEVLMTSKRAEIFKNLGRTKESDLTSLAKMLVLGDLVVELSTERNIIAHSLPYWMSADGSEIGYFKEENKTFPQISIQPPYVATIPKLEHLARQMVLVGACLGGLARNFLPNDIDTKGKTADEMIKLMREQGMRSPVWYDGGRFPWPDRLSDKVTKESRKPQNSHRVPKAPPKP